MKYMLIITWSCLLLISNCTTVEEPPEYINKPPETVILAVGAPIQDSEINFRVTIEWIGSDPDGIVKYYLFAWDDTTVWNDKTMWGDTNISIYSNRKEFEVIANEPDRKYHTFYIKAVDDDGLADPSSASRSFTAVTVLPDTKMFQGSPTDGARTSSYVTFRWYGTDEDGVISRYSFFFQDSIWHDTTVTSLTYRNLPEGEYRFGVKAIDNAGAEDPEPEIINFRVSFKVKPSIDLSVGPSQRQKIYEDTEVTFEWKGDVSSYFGLLHKIPYKYTFDDPDDLNWSDWTDTTEINLGLLPIGTHEFKLVCRDSLNVESTIKKREFEIIPLVGPKDKPLLIIDNAVLDSATDAKVLEILNTSFNNTQFDTWQITSPNPVDPPTLIDADVVSHYRNIFWYADDKSHFGLANTEPYNTYLKHFLKAGGTLIIFATEGIANLENRSAYPITFRTVDSASVSVQYMHINKVNSCGRLLEFQGAIPIAPNYPVLTVQTGIDTISALSKVEVFTFNSDVEVLYNFDSKTDHPQFEGLPCAFKVSDGNYKIIYFGFPFYNLTKEQAIQLLSLLKVELNL
jgi:hypothetical protein